MSVVNITQDRKTWTGSTSAKGREYSIDYLVQFDNAYQGCAAAVAALPLRIGSQYRVGNDGDSSAVLKSLDPKCDGGNLFRVTAKWGPRDKEQEEEEPDPFHRPVIWTYNHQTVTEAIWRDEGGQGILNSAGEYFDPPIESDVSRSVITAKRYVPFFDDLRADKYANTLNKDTWLTRKAGTVKCVGISGEGPQFENNVTFFSETLEFHIDPRGWDLKILDQGRNTRIAGSLVPIKVKDAAGNSLNDYISDPVPLTKFGNDALELDNPTPDTVEFLTFKIHKRVNFAELGL